MTDKKKGRLGLLALLTTTFIWGTSFVILKGALDSITPAWVMAYRFTGAFVLLLLVCIPRLKGIDRAYLRGGALMGICLASAYIVQTYGLAYTSPGKNAFLTSVYCILVPFLNWLILKRKPNKYNIIAAVMCMVGVGLVCLSGKDGIGSVNIGDLLTLCCGLFYGLHIIVTDKFVKTRDPILLTMIQFGVGAVACYAVAFAFEPRPEVMPGSAWLSIAYLSLVCTGVCFLLQTVGQKYTAPTRASIILMMESVFGTAISVICGQELLTFGILLGFCLIFLAVLISETKLRFLRKNSNQT
ncbi:MAG: DMT family transporter [Oscillospiraceae bacterium]|nr:DMT family transporter [Oscillospiraceae bacterium]